ncbi:putative uncharacterized protein DDB_G0289263 [Diaphorina citri]|uniref:Uncharacterized protein n=1 Tax=Diaphorina citri TaxID=121845 RepID=A0A1S3CY04_DIACI|nr:putative uncharacterized protein DDB_G0289263 [Diaphorina citri]
MFRSEVLVQDAIQAICLIESCMLGPSIIGDKDILHTCFPSCPDDEYVKQVSSVLKSLQLDDILNSELARLNEHKIQKAQHRATTTGRFERNSTQQTAGISQEINQVLVDIRKTKDKQIYEAMNKHRAAKVRGKGKTKLDGIRKLTDRNTNRNAKRKNPGTIDSDIEDDLIDEASDDDLDTYAKKSRQEAIDNEIEELNQIDNNDDEHIEMNRKKRRKVAMIESEDEEDINENGNKARPSENTDSLNQLVKLIETHQSQNSSQRIKNTQTHPDDSDEESILDKILSGRNSKVIQGNKMEVQAVVETREDITDSIHSENSAGCASQKSSMDFLNNTDDMDDFEDEFLSGIVSKQSQSISNKVTNVNDSSKINVRNENEVVSEFGENDIIRNKGVKESNTGDSLKQKIANLKRIFENKASDKKMFVADEKRNTSQNDHGSIENNEITPSEDGTKPLESSQRSSYFSNGDKATKQSNINIATNLLKIANEKRKPVSNMFDNISSKTCTVRTSHESPPSIDESKTESKLKAGKSKNIAANLTRSTDKNMDSKESGDIFKTPLKPKDNTTAVSNRTLSKLKMFSFERTSKDNASDKSPSNQKSESNLCDGKLNEDKVRDLESKHILKSSNTNIVHDGNNDQTNVRTVEKTPSKNTPAVTLQAMEAENSNNDLNNSLDLFSSSENTQNTANRIKEDTHTEMFKTSNILDGLDESDFDS